MPPPKRSNRFQQSRNASRLRNSVNQSTKEIREIARQVCCIIMPRLCASQRQERREAVRKTVRLSIRNRQAYRTDNIRSARRNTSSIDLN